MPAELFEDVLLEGGRMPWRGLGGSILTHMVLVPLLALGFSEAVRQPVRHPALTVSSLGKYGVVVLNLPADLLKRPEAAKAVAQMAQAASRPAAAPPPAPRTEPVPQNTPAAAPPVEAAAPAETKAPEAPAAAARNEAPKPAPKAFPMPSEPKFTREEVVILQPPTVETTVEKLSNVALPTITMVAPKPPLAKRVFDVGSLTKQRSMPKVEDPGPLPEPPQVNASSAAVRPRTEMALAQPKLPVNVAPPPLQTIEAPDKKAVSAGGPVVPQPANLVMSSSKPVPARATVEVPEVIVPRAADAGAANAKPADAKPGGRPGGTGTSAQATAPLKAPPGANGTATTATAAGRPNGTGTSVAANAPARAPEAAGRTPDGRAGGQAGGTGTSTSPRAAVIPPAGKPGGEEGGKPGGKADGTGTSTARPAPVTVVGGTGTGGSGNGAGAPGPVSGGGLGLDAIPPIRIIHPSTGRHDVMIVHSGVDQVLPEARGLLQCDPVYSVYLNVGWTREWTMHYCIPREGPAPARQVGGVVSLEPPIEVRAPYPNTTLVPSPKTIPAVLAALIGRRRPPLIYYGYLDAKGVLAEMKQKGSNEPEFAAKVLKSLESWEMRPATKNGTPTRVQVVLVAPLH